MADSAPVPDVYVVLADGFEETEAVVSVDILRRAGLRALTVSLGAAAYVEGRGGVVVKADVPFESLAGSARCVVLPGGPGHKKMLCHAGLKRLLSGFSAQGILLAAICAAPAVLASFGLLGGKRAVCYPGFEQILIDNGAQIIDAPVVSDGNVITSKGPGTSVLFALQIVRALLGDAVAESVANDFIA